MVPSGGDMPNELLITQILSAESLYGVLAVDRQASFEEIRKTYLRRSKSTHPDKNSHEHAKEAFHRLNFAYETLRNPKSRRIYDLTGSDGTRRRTTAADRTTSGDEHRHRRRSNQEPQPEWRDLINDAWTEFMAANFEPVVAVFDLMRHQNPDVLMSREQFMALLDSLRQVAVAGQDRYELVRADLQQLAELRARQAREKRSLFDVLGRSRHSLQITRLYMVVLGKILDGAAADSASCDSDSNSSSHSSDEGVDVDRRRDDDAESSGDVVDDGLSSATSNVNNARRLSGYIEGCVAAIDRLDEGMGKASQLWDSGISYMSSWRR